MFRFKRFSVDQSGCAMKINTDGVLLGAITGANDPATILDIGTGTGVIALMLAQRFNRAKIDAVEIDGDAAKTAERNFKASPFADRLNVYPSSFENYFDQSPGKQYDLIISNPPFYVDSLKSPGIKKSLAKHADIDFFDRLIKAVSSHLTPGGCCWLILPVALIDKAVELAADQLLYLQKVIYVHSYADSEPHRAIISLGFNKVTTETTKLIIYKRAGVYSEAYEKLLQPYFLAF